MKKLALIIFLFFTSSIIHAQEKDYTEAFELIEAWLEAQKDYENLPGLSAIVVEDQKVLWKGAFGYANAADKTKSATNTLYSICSISKLFTSIAIMKLYDEGKLRLDDKISDLLPWFNLKQQYSESGPITVRTLLTHSSGLPREAKYPYWTGPDFPFPTCDEVKAKLGEQKTLYPASTYFQYSNLGLSLLGEVVKEVSGKSFDEYIQENIIKPLNLSDTRTNLPKEFYGKQLSIGYSAIKRDGSRDKVNFFQAKGIKAAAGFSSNVIDLGKFASWQFRLLDTTVTEILKPSTLKYMQNVHYTDPSWETTWGLGFAVYKGDDGSKWVSHGGSCPGYRTTLRLNPSTKRAYSVMINAGGTNPSKYAKAIHKILKKVEKNPTNKTEKDLSAYKGFYNVQPWWGETFISTWQGKLVELSLPSESPSNNMTFYKHIENDTFRRIRDDGQLGETLVFFRDKKGKITSYKQHEMISYKK